MFLGLKMICDLEMNEMLNKSEVYVSIEEISKEIEKEDICAGYLLQLLRYMACFKLFDGKFG